MAAAGLMPVPEIQFRKYADPAAEQFNDCGTMRWRTVESVRRAHGGANSRRLFQMRRSLAQPESNEVQWLHGLGWRRRDALERPRRQELDFWAGCGNDADCVVVGGDPNDCTGVLLCDFAVARGYRSAAAKMVLDNSANRGVCADYCAVPSCPDPTQPVCDAVSRKCVLEMYPLTPSSTPDASTPLPPLPDAGADGP